MGEYPKEVFEEVRERNHCPTLHHTDTMGEGMTLLVGDLIKYSTDTVWKPEHFVDNMVKHLGKKVRNVAPVLQFADGTVKPGFQIGARTNGLDKPHWPADLSVEVVS